MRTERKNRAQELATSIQQSQSIEAAAIKELLLLQFEDAKTSLVEAQGDDILRKQGAALALKHLHIILTRKPAITKEQ